MGDSSLKWYYPPPLNTDLSKGYETFVKHDDSIDEHLDSLLETIASHEKEHGQPIDAHVVTWRGMLTKASTLDSNCFELKLTVYVTDHGSPI